MKPATRCRVALRPRPRRAEAAHGTRRGRRRRAAPSRCAGRRQSSLIPIGDEPAVGLVKVIRAAGCAAARTGRTRPAPPCRVPCFDAEHGRGRGDGRARRAGPPRSGRPVAASRSRRERGRRVRGVGDPRRRRAAVVRHPRGDRRVVRQRRRRVHDHLAPERVEQLARCPVAPGRSPCRARPSRPAAGTSMVRSIPSLSSDSRRRPESQSGASSVVMQARVSGSAVKM